MEDDEEEELDDLVLMQQKDYWTLIRLFDSRDKFMACLKDGKWVEDLIFEDDELRDFYLVLDVKQIEKVLAEARAALRKPLVL